MKSEWNDQEREAWFVARLDGELSDESVLEMDERLESTPALKAEFLAYAEVAKSLGRLRSARAPSRFPRMVQKRLRKGRRVQHWVQNTDLHRSTLVAMGVVLSVCAAAVCWWVVSRN